MCPLEKNTALLCGLDLNDKFHDAGQIVYLYYALCVLMRHNPSESAKAVSFLGSDLLWLYGKGLSVERSRATEGLGGCNFSALGVSVKLLLTLHKHAIPARKDINLCVFMCIP